MPQILQLLLALLLLTTSVTGQQSGPSSGSGATEFEQRLTQATTALRDLGLDPQAVTSVNYHVLFVGRKEFAEERKSILESTRRNFLGFMRQLKMPIDEKHGKLLVIVLDSQEQMTDFSRAVEPEAPPAEWVAGYYSSRFNWVVFFNQREGKNMNETEAWLNDMARLLINLPGGANSMVTVATPQGERRLTKKQLGSEMQQEWKRIIKQVNEFNTVVTQHEGAHQLAFNVGVQRREADYPFWLSEGLACVFEVPPNSKTGPMGAARRNDYRLNEYRQTQQLGQALGVRNLVNIKPGESVATVSGLYAESWALFSFLFQRQPDQLSDYMRFLAEKPGQAADETDDPAAAFEKHFGKTLDQTQSELDEYIKRLK